ncbi:MAG: hypothetical protein KDA28_01785, partial [Phycisphaerales bacterium]|nr:hypothetical protein [Phycisphaerales bacterium]
LRAETGDLVMNMQSNGGQHTFTGAAYVGNGVGIREVLQMDVNLVLRSEQDATGLLHLNSGFVSIHDFAQDAALVVEGTSLIRTTGTNPEDRIGFGSQGVNTIAGTLEVDGETWFVPGTQFIGEGTIEAVSTVKRTFFQEGSDLADVGFSSVGEVNLWSMFQNGTATMRAMSLGDTATLTVDMGDHFDVINSERYIVHDEAALAGTLELSWNGNGAAPVGQTVTILEAGTVTGAFDAIDDSGLGDNRRAYVTVTQDSVEVFITCAADLNADGVADIFDVTMFLNLFDAMDPSADLNDDGLYDFFDVLFFLNTFDEGC